MLVIDGDNIGQFMDNLKKGKSLDEIKQSLTHFWSYKKEDGELENLECATKEEVIDWLDEGLAENCNDNNCEYSEMPVVLVKYIIDEDGEPFILTEEDFVVIFDKSEIPDANEHDYLWNSL